jgi:hypothetical protein
MPMQRNDKKTCKRIAFRLLLTLTLTFSFSILAFGRTQKSEETPDIIVPEQAMEQVVRRVLVWNFKPRKQKKIIYLAEKGLQKSWLPEIEGIEFRLLSKAEIAEKDGVHFFTKLEKRSPSKYQMGFAFGDPNCYFEGANWYFRISKQKVRLWKPNEGFGGGCGIGSTNGYGSLISPQSNKSTMKEAVKRRVQPARQFCFLRRAMLYSPDGVSSHLRKNFELTDAADDAYLQ